MSIVLRVLLLVGSLLFLIYLVSNLRKSKMSIDMSVLWIVLSCLIVIMAIFPSPFITLIKLIGIESPVNGILIFFILALLLLVFYLFKKIAMVEFKLIELVQKIGIDEYKTKNKGKK